MPTIAGSKKIVAMIAGRDPIAETGGGHSTYVRAHALAAVRAGFQPHLFCASRVEEVRETDFGVVHRARSPRWRSPHLEGSGFRTNMIVRHVPLVVESLGAFLRENPRTLLVHGFGIWGCAGVRVNRRRRAEGHPAVPLVTSMYTSLRDEYEAKWRGVRLSDGWPATIRAARDLAWFAAVVARYEREAVRGSGRILVNYESVRKRLAAEYGARLPFRKIPYTSDSAFRPERALDCPSPGESPPRIPEGDGPLLLALSRHDPRKGVDVLLRALRILQTRDVPFRACLLGGGVILESHRRLVRSLGLESVVEITGFVADSAPYLRRAAVFVLPSLQEGSGSLSLIEAMQAGLPAVASDLDGIPEDTGTGRGALLVPPGDEHALAGALETLLRDEELRRRMANEAKGAFQSQFTADRLVEALGKIYTDDRAGVPTRRE